MSISRSGSARQALPAAAVLGQASAAGPLDGLAGAVATPPPLSAAAAAAAAAALASATTSSGGSGSAPLGRRKKLGRPIAFQGDINSQELTESERRHIRRCDLLMFIAVSGRVLFVCLHCGEDGGALADTVACLLIVLQRQHGRRTPDPLKAPRRRELNRASARRVRAKASATLGELATRMAQLEQHNSVLAAQVASVESDRSALQQQVHTYSVTPNRHRLV
jgi:bZIP transcription factor